MRNYQGQGMCLLNQPMAAVKKANQGLGNVEKLAQ